MITKEQFNSLKDKYGDYSSFAIWESVQDIGNIAMFDRDGIHKKLNNKYVFVALNPAERPADEKPMKFKNFHSDYPYQKDYKLCYALKETAFWGSYITDLFKSFPLTDSTLLKAELNRRPNDVEKDIESLKEEIRILAGDEDKERGVLLIAVGRATDRYLRKLFKGEDRKIVYIPHYSYWGHGCSIREGYKDRVVGTLLRQGIDPWSGAEVPIPGEAEVEFANGLRELINELIDMG